MLKRTSTYPNSARQQQGAALLVLLTLLVVAASYALLKRLNSERPDIITASRNAEILNSARAALLGYALSSTTRPGELPCPDIDNDGASDTGAGCGAYLGRLPWRTLGLADPRDESGERLWYALDTAFDSTTAINSDTTASLILNGGPVPYAAIVFAANESLQGQARQPAAQNNPARYLEGENSDGDLDYATTSAGDFNDQLTGVRGDILLQAVERRVLGELQVHLDDYFTANGYYPYPAALNTTTCNGSLQQGHLPLTINGTCPPAPDWTAALPGWFSGDGWNSLVWYAVAPACTQPSLGCTGPGGFVQVLNTPLPDDDKRAVLIAAGALRTGQNRSPAGTLTDLLDDTENNDNVNLVFSSLPVDAAGNDQILIVAP